MKTKTFRLVADSSNGFLGISFYKSLLDDFVGDAIIGYEKDGIVGMNENDFVFDMLSFRNEVGKTWCKGYEECLKNFIGNYVSVEFVSIEKKCDYAYCDYSINFDISLPIFFINEIIRSLRTNGEIINLIKEEFSCNENKCFYLSSDSFLWVEFIDAYMKSGEDKTPFNNIETYIAYAIHYWLTYEKGIDVSDYMWDCVADYIEYGNYVSLSDSGKEKIKSQEGISFCI